MKLIYELLYERIKDRHKRLIKYSRDNYYKRKSLIAFLNLNKEEAKIIHTYIWNERK